MRILALSLLLLLSSAVQAQSTFTFNNGAEPESLDPHIITGLSEMRLAEALYEGLVNYHPETLTPVPGVATSWTVSKDGLKYTFYINPKAQWSDGTPVTAHDFILSWKRVLTAKTGVSYASLFFMIKGAEDFYTGKLTTFAKVGMKAVDPLTLTVELRNPCGYFLDLVAFSTLYPIRVDLLEKFKSKWMEPQNLVTNGAFTLSKWEPRQQIVLKKNPHYWDKDTVKLDTVVALPLDDLNTAYKMYLEGSIHWLSAVPTPKIEEIKRNPDYYAAPYLGTYFYRFNVTKAPYSDVHLRKALLLATDRKAITAGLLKGGQTPVSSFCPPVAGYTPIEGLDYNPEQARREFEKSAYAKSSSQRAPLEILYNTSESHKQIAEAIAQQWKEVLGVQVVTRNQEWKVYLADTKALKYDIARSSWVGDYGDPATFFSIFRGGDGNNRTGWKNDEYDTLLKASERETDPDKRRALFTKMELLLVTIDPPILPIYRYVNQGMLREEVLGWFENIRDIHPMKYIYLEKTKK